MPIEIACPSCKNRLRVGDQNAGKRVRCPKCQGVVEVPSDSWYLKTADGQDYGPVPKSELDEWMREGRVTADCQLLREGADQWQWATDVYAQLASAQSLAASSAGIKTPSPTPSGKVATSQPSPFDFAASSPSPAGSGAAVGTGAASNAAGHFQFSSGGAPATAPSSETGFSAAAAESGGFSFASGGGGSGAAPDRARAYPAAMTAQKMYRLFGVLVIVAGILGAIGVVITTLPLLFVASGFSSIGLIIGMFLTICAIALYTAIGAITLWFLADAIQIAMDVQKNTHRSTQLLQQLVDRGGEPE